MEKIPTHLLSLAGEYRVCSEIIKRGAFATVTYGNQKAVDVYVINDRSDLALKIEVKTSQKNGFVTSITQKGLADDPQAPDFWVLFHLKNNGEGNFAERFFVLSHAEICAVQKARNRAYGRQYKAKHGRPYDFSTGVDNVRMDDVLVHEDAWYKIVDRAGRP